MAVSPQFVTSVGMEVHAELLTESKMFCRCPVAFGGEPNTRVCPVCLGMPGTLPVPNHAAIDMVLRTAIALNCTIAMDSVFHRKNYFYPDLPKGYQVTQYGETNPFGYKGWLDVPTKDGSTKRVSIRRVHLEEDTGKLVHFKEGGSGVDYNRAGVPLMEIVTDFPPDLDDPESAKEYLVQLRAILVWIGVCDGRMEEGSLRCEPNISVRPAGSTEYGTKTELKNLNSFRSVQLGVDYESKRQIQTLANQGRVKQETRGWNETTLSSYLMREKETEADYRYFPDPDLVPMRFTDEYIESLKATIPELPLAKCARYQSQFGLSQYDADVLTSDRSWAEFFEETVGNGGDAKVVCNLMNGDIAKHLNDTGLAMAETPLTPNHVASLAKLMQDGTVNSKTAKKLITEMFTTGGQPDDLVAKLGLTQISDTAFIAEAVANVIGSNPGPVAEFRQGKENVIGFLVGLVMKETQGKANPSLVQEEMRKRLKE